MKKAVGYVIAGVLFFGFIVYLTLQFSEYSGENVLSAPPESPGFRHNDLGIKHFNDFRWDLAEKDFLEAIKADKKLAVAYYNLGLSLHSLERHGDASRYFAYALKLAPYDINIADSSVLKNHLYKKR